MRRSLGGRSSSFFMAAAVLSICSLTIAPARAACTVLTTAADLNKIHTNLNADYCLGNDIDAGSIANFTPAS